jgi:hypothetical protein
MKRENPPLVARELVEFDKYMVEVQNFRKTIDRFREI